MAQAAEAASAEALDATTSMRNNGSMLSYDIHLKSDPMAGK
jgi:hypothetical protein